MFALAFAGNTAALRASLVAAGGGAAHDVSSDRKHTLLYTASRAGHLDTVSMLVTEFGANVNAANLSEDGSRPIHGACYGGHHAVVQFLVAHGADASVRNAFGEAPKDNAKRPAPGVTKPQSKLCIDALSTPVLAPTTLASPPTAVTPAAALSSPPKISSSVVSPPHPLAADKAKLEGLTLAELRGIAINLNCVLSGTKADLVDRILAATMAAADPASLPSPAPPAKKHMAEAAPAPPAVAVPPPPPPASPPKPPTVPPQVATPAVVVAPAAAPPPQATGAAASVVSTGSGVDSAEWINKLRAATFTKVEVPRDTEDFWALEERVMACNQRHNEDYVTNRLKKKKKPLTFIVKRAWKVTNPTLEEGFQRVMATFAQEEDKQLSRVRVAFHGTREANIDSILKTSLLRFQHPLNPCKEQADDGYFGTNKKGVYVSRYYEYTLKYSNGLVPLDEGECAKVIMFKCLPGKSKHIEKLNMGMDPTPGFNSHSSPSYLEWYLFDECQLCPEYVIELQAKVDTRTAADDE